MDDRASSLPTLAVTKLWEWERATGGPDRSALEQALARAITTRRWFGAKTRAVDRLEIVDAAGVTPADWLLLVKIHYAAGPAEVYQVPLGFAAEGGTARLDSDARWIAVQSNDGRRLGVLYDALADVEFCRQLLGLFESQRRLVARGGEFVARQTERFGALRGERADNLAPKAVRSEQSNSSVIYGDRLILKVFRRVEMGQNPDIEISEFLSRQGFAHTPPLAGSLEYRTGHEEPWDLAMLQAFVPNQGDAWQFTLAWLAKSLVRLTAGTVAPNALVPIPRQGVVRAAEQPIPPAARAAFGEFLASVARLGRRTAEMHLALASVADDPAFAPEVFSETDRRAYFEQASEQARETFELLGKQISRLPRELAHQVQRVLALENTAHERYRRLAGERVRVHKIRCHGDYHLGQVLVSDNDFVIIDFEGEPARPVSQRRAKQLALRDVAGMVRSLHYASCAAAVAARGGQTPDGLINAWTGAWYAWTSATFLAAYRRTAGGGPFVPAALDEFERLLDGCLLEKAIYELRYELNNRPDWVELPLEALEQLLGARG